MSEDYDLTLVEYIRDGIEKLVFAAGIMENFGFKANLDDFIQSTEGIISLKPCFAYISPSVCSNYPFEIIVRYKGTPKEGLKPMFGNFIRYDERVERISEEICKSFTYEGLKT